MLLTDAWQFLFGQMNTGLLHKLKTKDSSLTLARKSLKLVETDFCDCEPTEEEKGDNEWLIVYECVLGLDSEAADSKTAGMVNKNIRYRWSSPTNTRKPKNRAHVRWQCCQMEPWEISNNMD